MTNRFEKFNDEELTLLYGGLQSTAYRAGVEQRRLSCEYHLHQGDAAWDHEQLAITTADQLAKEIGEIINQ